MAHAERGGSLLTANRRTPPRRFHLFSGSLSTPPKSNRPTKGLAYYRVVRNAAVIGGGPAGSLAALLLARSGWSLTLFEQHRFPRDKVCGECISALGVEVLRRAGLMAEVISAGAVVLKRAIVHGRGGSSIVTALPKVMFGLSRRAFDGLILEAARNAGAALCQPARVEAMLPGGAIRVRDLRSNGVSRVQPDIVLLADGKGALGSRTTPGATGDIGIKTHFTGVDGPRDAIELFGCNGCYGGLAAIEGDRWNAAFSVPATRVRAHRGDMDALFSELVLENAGLGARLAGATRVMDWLASPLPRFGVRRRWPAGVIPLGNAAAAIEPIGGEGMGLALRSAELAAAGLDARDGEWNGADQRRLLRKFDVLWRMRRFACRATAMIVSNGPATDVALEVARGNAGLTRIVMSAIGK